ncbi:hypothetical protein MLD38_002574 [Melastoma candidum]|uniref:Uncharacterized protein n=1 Tax=Melastoma candidum TaxID=119954 RepID=A0ACB9S0D0_9MYRT|nr:hypothetical protein MLD38_002574 [Melastoma candidum]
MGNTRFLFSDGVLSRSPDVPPVSSFLQSRPGAYTTTRTHNHGACVLFWERHIDRLLDSARILLYSDRELLFGSEGLSARPFPSMNSTPWESRARSLVCDSLGEVLPVPLMEEDGEELAITILLSGNLDRLGDPRKDLEFLDVHLHVDGYVPTGFGAKGSGAHLALVGRGREAASAKYSDWVRRRKHLQRFRPCSATELLLSNDGDHVLEGSVTNFFTVCRREDNENELKDGLASCFEVQTAPVSDGVLPGVIRQLVIEVCLSKGIPFREVAPSWAMRELWEEAFITSSLRLLQHVEAIEVPVTWEHVESRSSYDDLDWTKKSFKSHPGMITTMIQAEIMKRASLEGYPVSLLRKTRII